MGVATWSYHQNIEAPAEKWARTAQLEKQDLLTYFPRDLTSSGKVKAAEKSLVYIKQRGYRQEKQGLTPQRDNPCILHPQINTNIY